ncbi:hypothetical protein MMC18_004675 [Xylographa bjoerkii]|nr:hypothetical protein [Xylographa bjoerkii]
MNDVVPFQGRRGRREVGFGALGQVDGVPLFVAVQEALLFALDALDGGLAEGLFGFDCFNNMDRVLNEFG